MTIDIEEETLLKLSDVPALPWLPARRGGAKLHVSTVHRWAVGGHRGVVLETVSVGGMKCTTERCLLAFFEKLGARKPSIVKVTSSEHLRAQRRARAILENAGVYRKSRVRK